MAHVDVWRCWIQPKLDAQWRARHLGACQFPDPVVLRDQLLAPAQGQRQCLPDGIGQQIFRGFELCHRVFMDAARKAGFILENYFLASF